MTSLSHYNISYLRRGLYGSTEGASTGNSFVRCDDSLFKFPYNPIYAGRAIKLKFVAYNSYNEGQQDLATVTAYDFTLAGTAWDASASQWDAGATLWTS